MIPLLETFLELLLWNSFWDISSKTVIWPVVLYGCETWSLILAEEHRLSVFENSVEEDIWT